MIDLRLDKDTHDIVIGNADLRAVSDLEEIEQSLKERLLFYREDWFIDTVAGIPFYNEVLVKNPNVPNIENIIKAEIMDTPNTIELLEFNSSFDSSARSFSVNFRVRTEFGIASVQANVF